MDYWLFLSDLVTELSQRVTKLFSIYVNFTSYEWLFSLSSNGILTGFCLLIIKVTVKNWPLLIDFTLLFFLNSIGLLAKKKKNYNNVT